MNPPNYNFHVKILRPASEVFQAIVDAEKLKHFFVERASRSMASGAEIVWHWRAWGDYPVKIKKLLENELIEIELDSTQWKKTTDEGYKVLVSMKLEAVDPQTTMLYISESGWQTDAAGLKASHENCSGWTNMAMCLKAWMEHGIDLR